MGRAEVIHSLGSAGGTRLMHEYALENSSVMLCAVCHRQLAPAFAFCPYCSERKMSEDSSAPRHVSILEMGVVEK
jgi:hypothetical protein